jgi:branched-chain amino acid transport system ATP-binding protein
MQATTGVTLIGSNDAGKITTLRSIHGILPPREGKVLFAGEEIQGLPAHDMISRGIAQSPEGRKNFHRMTVRENLEMGAYHRNDNTGVRLVEQNANVALEIATRGYVLETGSIVNAASAEKLREDPKVRESYLG